MNKPKYLLRLELIDDGDGGERIGVSGNGEAAFEQAIAAALGDLRPEALDDLPLVLEHCEIGKELLLLVIGIDEQVVVHVLGTHVARRGLEKHPFVEATPNVLGRVDDVLDAAGRAVGPGSGLGMELGLGLGLGLGEGADAVVYDGDVAGDAVAGALHADDGIGGVDQVAVPVADELPELLLLVLDLLPRRHLRLPDLGDGLRAEEGLGVAAADGGDTVVIGARQRRRRGWG